MDKQYVVTREEMYQLDKKTMQDFAIESQVLMEIAGLKSSQGIIKYFPTDKYTFLILCGHGNNGGDGFVIARWLLNMKADVQILFVGDIEKMSPETKNNYHLCQKLNSRFLQLSSFSQEVISTNRVVIDCLLGIGFQGILKEPYARLIKDVNKLNNPRVAIDIPSGLNANTGDINVAFKADYTFTMAAIKQGMLLNSAPSYCGQIEIIDISIPNTYYQSSSHFSLLNTGMKYPQRLQHSHKGDYGKLLIIAGSVAYSGAAILSSKAAIKCGAGLVKLLHPKGMETIFESELTEVMTTGVTSETNLSPYLEWADAILIGPGLGQSREAEHIFNIVIKHFNKEIVIDADGLNILAKNKSLIMRSNAKILLTPHLGEFSRLCGIHIDELKRDIIRYARAFVKDYPVSLLLKASKTLFIDREKSVFNTTGNDGLSTGGSGDVLAGIISSFLVQKLEIDEAAISASYYLGKLVEEMSKFQAPFSIIPSEVINNIGKFNIK